MQGGGAVHIIVHIRDGGVRHNLHIMQIMQRRSDYIVITASLFSAVAITSGCGPEVDPSRRKTFLSFNAVLMRFSTHPAARLCRAMMTWIREVAEGGPGPRAY